MNRQSDPIFVIFEGGGAKAVAHLGALDAIFENHLEIVGVAGTSAGAIVATLVSVGFTADEILNKHEPTKNILAAHNQSVLAILGKADWKRLEKLLKVFDRLKKAELVLVQLWYWLRLGLLLRQFSKRTGYISTQSLREFVNEVIKSKILATHRQGIGEITFQKLYELLPTMKPLKIVATDIHDGSPFVFGRFETPLVKVADAITASMAIPGVFEPVQIPELGNRTFVDGGIVSNFPTWVLLDEKLNAERANHDSAPIPIVGFSLFDPNRPRFMSKGGTFDSFKYFGAVFEATLSGGQSTVQRLQEDLTIIKLSAPISTLEFDAGPDKLNAVRNAAYASANEGLKKALLLRPKKIRKELTRIRNAALNAMNKSFINKIDQLRVNFIRKHDHYSLKVIDSVGMEADADDRLLLDYRGRGSAQAFREKSIRLVRLRDEDERRDAEYMTKYERALVRPKIDCVLCIPVFRERDAWANDPALRPDPLGVLSFDSDQDFSEILTFRSVLDEFVDISVVLSEVFVVEM